MTYITRSEEGKEGEREEMEDNPVRNSLSEGEFCGPDVTGQERKGVPDTAAHHHLLQRRPTDPQKLTQSAPF